MSDHFMVPIASHRNTPISRIRWAAISRIFRVSPIRRTALFAPLLALMLVASSAFAQQDELEATIGGNVSVSYPVQQIGPEHYLSISNLKEFFRTIDPTVTSKWDASTGIFTATLRGKTVTFYQDRNELRVGDSIIDAKPLLATRGQSFVPLSSLERVLRTLPDIQTNLSRFVSPDTSDTSAPPAAGATAAPSPASGGLDEIPALPGIGPPTSPTPLTRTVDPQTARSLLARRVFILDPQGIDTLAKATTVTSATATANTPSTTTAVTAELPPIPTADTSETEPTTSTEPNLELTVRVAERCREILEANPSVRVVLTIPASPTGASTATAPLSPEQRVQTVNSAQGKALISLRLDSSPFPNIAGYRIFTTTPPSRASLDAAPVPTGSPSPETSYFPYQDFSESLGRILDAELARGGLAAAPDRMKTAPLYLLRRSSLPSACVTLGYTTSDKDRARFSDTGYVESAARSLAQSLLEFDRYLQQSAGDAN